MLVFNIAATVTLLAQSPGGTKNTPSLPIDLEVKTATASSGISPGQNENPLDGVDTWDLVLISRHILGIEPLGSPYKMIAADANKSNSITTTDVVEFRKLILGLYQELPNSDSWRFVRRAFVFPNPQNPFQPAFPEDIAIDALNPPYPAANFVAIKMGDVNNTVVASGCPGCNAPRPAGTRTLLTTGAGATAIGGTITIPILVGGNVPLTAWQAAFRFDPAQMELIGPSMGDAAGLSLQNFNLNDAAEGLVKALWFAPPEDAESAALQPGQVLFYLTFRVRQALSGNAALLSLDETAMPCLAWESGDGMYALTLDQTRAESRERSDSKTVTGLVSCRPNPADGEFVFDISEYPQPKRAQLTVFDAFGRRVWQRDLSKMTTPAQISVPEAKTWPSGAYQWELRRDKERESGVLVKQ